MTSCADDVTLTGYNRTARPQGSRGAQQAASRKARRRAPTAALGTPQRSAGPDGVRSDAPGEFLPALIEAANFGRSAQKSPA